MGFTDIVNLIKEGEFKALTENIQEHLKHVETTKQFEQIFGQCSHFIYDKNISEKELSCLIGFITLMANSAGQKLKNQDCVDILKSLYYIVMVGVRKGLDIRNTLELSNQIEIIMHSCDSFYMNHSELLKKMHSSLWNLSLEKRKSPSNALALQGQALGFLSLSGDNVLDVCNYAKRVGKHAENASCSSKDISAMYKKVLTNIMIHMKTRTFVQDSSLLALHHILIEYAKNIFLCQRYNEFSLLFKPLSMCLEKLCDPKVILGFKMSLKIAEASMAYVCEKCNIDLFQNILKGSKVISKSKSANSILIEGLLFSHCILQEKVKDEKPPVYFDANVVHSVFSAIMERSSADTIGNENLLKVLEIFGNHLNALVNNLMKENQDIETLFEREKYYTSKLPEVLRSFWGLRGEIQMYNIGINCCNLGVIAFKAKKYKIAAEFFDAGIKYLNSNCDTCDEDQKRNIMSILKKKAVLLKDSLRYHSQYKEAIVKTFEMVFLKLLPISDVLPTWIKCKKEAHKGNSKELKNVCIKDIYMEIRNKYDSNNIETINIEELVVEELNELQLLSYNTAEDQLSCVRSLMDSEDSCYVLEGLLARTRVLWFHQEYQTDKETPMKIIWEAMNIIDMGLKCKGPSQNSKFLEYKARCSLWLYLCNLQIIQEENEEEIEEKNKEEETLTVQSTDLGEEIQPHDACSIRPAAAVATFATQQKTIEFLHQALQFWEKVKVEDVQRSSVMCDNLLSIGFIYKLRGLLLPCIKSFSLLLKVASNEGLTEMWVCGLKELMDLVPELISPTVAHRLKSLLLSESSDSTSKLPENLVISCLSSLGYYFFKKGEFSVGAELVQHCLSSPVMEKRTPLATEAQIGVYYTASCYASLPQSLLPESLIRPERSCLILALNGTRKAIGLIKVAIESNYHENLCWHHKVAWLHHTAIVWLGYLCHATAQPRIARAYLRQALALAEKLALPLRTVELLFMLSEIDLQCNQLNDCRIKIDSLSTLLNVHSCPKIEDTLRSSTRLKKKPVDESVPPSKKVEEKVPSAIRLKEPSKNQVPIYSDGDEGGSENMRDCHNSPDFVLKSPSLHLGKQLFIIGEEKRIGALAQESLGQCPPSPSDLYGEENLVIGSLLACPDEVAGCDVCSAPELLAISVKANVCLGVIQAQKKNMRNSRLCFKQAQEDLKRITEASSRIASNLCSILKASSTLDDDLICEDSRGREDFIKSQLDMVEMYFLFTKNEVHGMERDFEVMAAQIPLTMKCLASLNFSVLATNHSLIVQLIVQCHAMSRAVSKRREISSEEDESELDSSLVDLKCEAKKPQAVFKTPARVGAKGVRSDVVSNCKSASKTSRTQGPVTPFRIFSDDDDSPPFAKGNLWSTAKKSYTKAKKINKMTTNFAKLNLESDGASSRLTPRKDSSSSPMGGPLRSRESPFSQVLKLPSGGLEKATTSPKEPLVANSKLRKLVTKPEPKDGIASKKALKENSPIVPVRLEPPPGRVTRARRAKGKEESAATSDTLKVKGSRRNLKRL